MKRLGKGFVTVAAAVSPVVFGVAGASAAAPTVDGIAVDGNNLTLTKDVSACLEIGANDSFTLDLAGYTLTNAVPGCVAIWLHDGGALTITDSSESGNGTVVNTADSLYPLINNESGVLDIYDGSFSSINTTTGRYTPVINTTTGTTTIRDGLFIQNGAYNAIQMNGAGWLQILDGAFINADEDNNSGVVGTTENPGSTINIQGGTFVAGNGKFSVLDWGENNKGTITGGTFTGKIYSDHKMVAGGTWGIKPTQERIADGYIARENTEGKFVVSQMQVVSNINVATSAEVDLGEEKKIGVSYNNGFLVSDIDADESGIVYESGTSGNVAWFAVDDEGNADFNTMVVYGSEVGSTTFKIIIKDIAGNEITKNVTVTVRDALKAGGYGNMNSYTSYVEFKNSVAGGRSIYSKIEAKTAAELEAIDKDLKLLLDIVVKDADDKTIDVKNNEITITLYVKKSLLGENIKGIQIAYVKDGRIVEYIDPESCELRTEGDEEWYQIIFKTTHLSDYGILTSSTTFPSAADRNAALGAAEDEAEADAPDTGRFTANNSGAQVFGAALASVIVALLVAGVSFKKLNKR